MEHLKKLRGNPVEVVRYAMKEDKAGRRVRRYGVRCWAIQEQPGLWRVYYTWAGGRVVRAWKLRRENISLEIQRPENNLIAA